RRGHSDGGVEQGRGEGEMELSAESLLNAERRMQNEESLNALHEPLLHSTFCILHSAFCIHKLTPAPRRLQLPRSRDQHNMANYSVLLVAALVVISVPVLTLFILSPHVRSSRANN